MHQATTPSNELLADSLRNLGFRRNPFAHPEASTDPYLSEYIVGHETFAVAWSDAPALIFAPAGGGKTATRIYTSRSCWIGLGKLAPFPIPYVIPDFNGTTQEVSIDDHLPGILEASANALLIGLAFRPERFLGLHPRDKREIANFMDSFLPSSLLRYLDILRDTGDPLALAQMLEPTYLLPDPPPHATLLELCAGLEAAAASSDAFHSPKQAFERMVELVLGALEFRSIFVLIDGVDAFPETLNNPLAATNRIRSLLEQAGSFGSRRIFMKGFLPIELEEFLLAEMPRALKDVQCARLNWDTSLLSEVIRRRVLRATAGKFGSLDAISAPQLRDVETQLVCHAKPLPREALRLVTRLLIEFTRRTASMGGELEQVDIDAALEWYKNQPAMRQFARVS